MFGQIEVKFDPYSKNELDIEPITNSKDQKEKYTYNILGTEIIVFPEVFSPKFTLLSSAEFLIQNMTPPQQKRVLDVGTGTGVLGLVAAIKGASLVHATDINPIAVENARANFKKYNFGEDHCLAYQSDLFENVHAKFDLILFNPPHQGFATDDMLERAFGDENYSFLRRFFSEVGEYLTADGNVLMTFSEVGDLKLLEELILKSDLAVEKIVEEQRPLRTFFICLKIKPQL